MIITEKKPGWIARNRNTVFLMVCVIVRQVFFYFTTTASSKREIERSKALRPTSRVDKILFTLPYYH